MPRRTQVPKAPQPAKTKRELSPRMRRERAVPKMVYSLTELKLILGVSLPTIRLLLKDGALKSIRVGKRVLVPKAALDAYLAGR